MRHPNKNPASNQEHNNINKPYIPPVNPTFHLYPPACPKIIPNNSLTKLLMNSLI